MLFSSTLTIPRSASEPPRRPLRLQTRDPQQSSGVSAPNQNSFLSLFYLLRRSRHARLQLNSRRPSPACAAHTTLASPVQASLHLPRLSAGGHTHSTRGSAPCREQTSLSLALHWYTRSKGYHSLLHASEETPRWTPCYRSSLMQAQHIWSIREYKRYKPERRYPNSTNAKPVSPDDHQRKELSHARSRHILPMPAHLPSEETLTRIFISKPVFPNQTYSRVA